jgi:hypothetical protein
MDSYKYDECIARFPECPSNSLDPLSHELDELLGSYKYIDDVSNEIGMYDENAFFKDIPSPIDMIPKVDIPMNRNYTFGGGSSSKINTNSKKVAKKKSSMKVFSKIIPPSFSKKMVTQKKMVAKPNIDKVNNVLYCDEKLIYSTDIINSLCHYGKNDTLTPEIKREIEEDLPDGLLRTGKQIRK